MTIFKEVMIKRNKPSAAMKTEVCILAFLAVLTFVPGMPAQETFRGGIVYGPKAAFKIDAPEGWVLDNKSGANKGCHVSFTRRVHPGQTRKRSFTRR